MTESWWRKITEEVMSRYDVIGFDPRGWCGSEPVGKCLTDAERDERRALTFDIETEEGMDAFLAEAAAYAEKCSENTGPGLGFIDTVSAASDMDIIRSSVGDDQLHYVGYSYGTFLGARSEERR